MSDSNLGATISSKYVDKSQVPPIEQKRMAAFINHFVVTTTEFLNEFIANVESKFIELETKLRFVESSLLIVESKMASIPDLDSCSETVSNDKPNQPVDVVASTEAKDEATKTESTEKSDIENENRGETVIATDGNEKAVGVRACDDARYRKFFKMLQFGVPMPAVKLKMQIEGLESSILDEANAILPDGIADPSSSSM